MTAMRVRSFLVSLTLLVTSNVFAADAVEPEAVVIPVQPKVGSWTFSGMVANESGENYGYFFQVLRQGSDFYAKTALVDGQTNKLVFFYEKNEKIEDSTNINWHVGQSFIRYNPINDSWIFGVKADEDKGFNFKVDMMKHASNDTETISLRPGVELQAIQTSSLNGHIKLGDEAKEQFVTGNNAWYSKLWFSTDQKTSHAISTTFCRLGNENGFYSANLKEADATRAAVAGWRDAAGNKVKMSQFITVKPLKDNQCLLSVGLPRLNLKLYNTLKTQDKAPLSFAGFSKQNPKGFCFLSQQSFQKHEALG